ncbi:MAG TPA: type II toxin-antitoxin system RelE/ParE family toxin [Brevundimonas sp.]
MLPSVWAEEAIQDVETLVAYIAQRNSVAALRIRNLIVDAAQRLGEHPYLYREGRERGTREVVVHPNYIIVYRVELAMIRVVNVLHASRQYPPL